MLFIMEIVLYCYLDYWLYKKMVCWEEIQSEELIVVGNEFILMIFVIVGVCIKFKMMVEYMVIVMLLVVQCEGVVIVGIFFCYYVKSY